MKKALTIGIICILAVMTLFSATDPNKVPSFILPVPFVLLFIALIVLIAWLFQKNGMAARRSWRFGVLCAGIPSVLLVLQSIGQLTIKDVLTIVVLFGVSYFYIARAAAPS